MKRTFLTNLFFVVLLYLLLFDPPFLFFRGLLSPSNLIILFSCIYVALRPFIIRNVFRDYGRICWIFILLFVYVIVRSGVEGDTSFPAEHFLAVLSMFATAPFLIDYAKRKGFERKDIIKAILTTSAIGSVISLLCLLIPPFNAFIKYHVIQYSTEALLFDLNYRGFGFANQLTSTYGYIQGIVFSLGLFYIKENKWVALFLPFIFLSALLNARTGTLVAMIGFALYVFSFGKGRRSIGSKLALIILLAGYLFVFRFINFSEDTSDWLSTFFNDITAVATERDITASRTTYLLFNRMWVLPETTMEWIFGKGYSIYTLGSKIRQNSDVGWIIQLNYGGLIYFVGLISGFWYIFKRIYKNKNKELFFFLLASFMIINTKCSIYPRPGLIPLFMLILYLTTENRLINSD